MFAKIDGMSGKLRSSCLVMAAAAGLGLLATAAVSQAAMMADFEAPTYTANTHEIDGVDGWTRAVGAANGGWVSPNAVRGFDTVEAIFYELIVVYVEPRARQTRPLRVGCLFARQPLTQRHSYGSNATYSFIFLN